VLPPRTTDSLSKPCHGSCARAARGETYRKNLATGTGHMCASRAGARRGSGSTLPQPFVAMPTWSTCSSTQPSSVPTNTPLVPNKGGRSEDRPLARRTDHQTARCRRCIGQTAARHSLRRSDCRYRLCLGTDRESAGSRRGGRQGADHFVANIRAAGAEAVIPPRSNRLVPGKFDRHLYRARNLIERFFARLKHFRRIATRYDKLAKSFLRSSTSHAHLSG
jgi:hypothetical protein